VDYPVRTASELHRILKAFRKSAGLTQAGVAGLLGITQQTYAALEANPGSASTERVLRVLRILKVDMSLSWSVRPRRTAPRTPSPADARERTQAPQAPQSAGKPKVGAATPKRAAVQVAARVVGQVASKGKQGAALSAGSGARGKRDAASAPTSTKRVIRKREDW
jgi:HTH-type transcriptional regulator/antitoxin HipB